MVLQIIAALVKLSSASSKKILKDFPCTRVQTANCAAIANKQIFPYCENPALCLQYPGVKYNALNILADTPEISDVDRKQLFDCLNCFYCSTRTNRRPLGLSAMSGKAL